MGNWLLNNLPTLIISIGSLLIAIKSWHKTRVFYDIEVFELHHNDSFGIQNKDLRDKLNTGKYTILNTYRDEAIDFSKFNPTVNASFINKENFNLLPKVEKVFILLGKIKK